MAMKELRLDVDETDMAVLDGYVMATGTSKAEAIRMNNVEFNDEKMPPLNGLAGPGGWITNWSR